MNSQGYSSKPKQGSKSKTTANPLKYACQFCGEPTNYKDWSGEYCAKCYGESRPPYNSAPICTLPHYPYQPPTNPTYYGPYWTTTC